jgi:hypothetical protein
VSYTKALVALWELVFMLVILKIPVLYVGSVVWWAVKAEPELGTEGGTEGVNWTPWRRPPNPSARPHRGGPVRTPARQGRTAARRSARVEGFAGEKNGATWSSAGRSGAVTTSAVRSSVVNRNDLKSSDGSVEDSAVENRAVMSAAAKGAT